MPSKIYAEIPYLLQGIGPQDPAWGTLVRALTSLASALEADLSRMEQRLDQLEAEAIEPE
jgi:hypothetical protein